jgi:hypothetical protein
VAPTEDSELGLQIRDIPNKGRGVVVGPTPHRTSSVVFWYGSGSADS